MTYPCRKCERPAHYELLPADVDSLDLPAYWCRACWDQAFGRLRTTALVRTLRVRGALRELDAPARDGPEA